MKKIKFMISEDDVDLFSKFSGDKNPIHLDDSFARRTPFKKRIAHGTIILSKISGLLTEEFGEGNILLTQSVRFLKPAYLEETIEIKIQKLKKKDGGINEVEIIAVNSLGEKILECISTCTKIYLKYEQKR